MPASVGEARSQGVGLMSTETDKRLLGGPYKDFMRILPPGVDLTIRLNSVRTDRVQGPEVCPAPAVDSSAGPNYGQAVIS